MDSEVAMCDDRRVRDDKTGDWVRVTRMSRWWGSEPPKSCAHVHLSGEIDDEGQHLGQGREKLPHFQTLNVRRDSGESVEMDMS